MNPRQILEKEFLTRRQRNPHYSLRAFSKMLGVPSGRVSQLLTEKRRFTPKLGAKIVKSLNYDPRQAQDFLRAIGETRKPGIAEVPPASSLDMEKYETIADPVHFAILSLLETENFAGTAAAVAARLSISTVEARRALRRLITVELVKAEGDAFRLAGKPGLATSQDISSAAIRRAHRQHLAENAAALEEVAVELRDISSITMAVDPARLPEAKKRIQDFRRSLSAFLEGGVKREVYRIDIQLVPLTGRGKQ
jgi:hypothetical protein